MRRDTKSITLACALLAAFAAGCSQEEPAELLQKANSAFDKREFSTAEIHLKNLLQNQDDGRARLLLARTYAARQDWPSAEKEFRRALDLGANADDVAPGMLETMFHNGQSDKVIEQFEKLKMDDPVARSLAGFWLARAHMSRKEHEKARRAFEDSLRLNPTLTKAKVGMLELQALRGGQMTLDALAALDPVLAADPDSREALMLQAELRFATGDPGGARAPLEAVVLKWPRDVNARSRLIEADIALRELDSARSRLPELLKLAPAWPVGLTQQARLDLLDGKVEAARNGALEALKNASEYPPALATAGAAMLALGSLEQAESYARQLIKTAPTLPNGPQLLAAILLKKGAADQALQVIEPLLDVGSKDAQLLTIAGEAALRSGNAKASEEYFARAAKLDSKDPRKRVGLALARLGTGDRAGALADLEAASAMDGELIEADQILIATALRNREFARALASIDRLEKKHPESGEGPYLRGRVALAQGDVGRARGQFEQALKINPSLLPAVSSLAALDVKEGKALEAKRRYEVVVKDNPKNASALLALANLTTETGGATKESLDLLKRAQDADPNNEAATLSLAQGLIAQGQAREAVQVLQQAARNHPDWVKVPEALAVAHIRAGETARAHEVIDNFGKRKRDDAGVQYRLGSLKTALKDHAGALEYFRRAQALQPTAVEPRVNIAMSQARLGRFEEAVGTARQLQSEFKDTPVGWMLEGEVHRSAQKWREAATAFRKAHDLDPSQQAIALKLHDSLARSGSKDEAERLLQGWLKAAPKDEKLNLYAGERALLDKRYAESVRYYEAAVAVNPGNGSALNNLAWALHQLKDPKALAAAEKAYQLAPKSAAVVDTLATILGDNKQTQRSLALHREAAALAPRSPELRLKLGQALKNSGDKDGARQELDAVVRDFPGTPQAAAARQLSAEL